jgi:hypothetical protein
MKISNYRYNRLGGVDADRELNSGEIVPYTLTNTEISELEGVEIAPFDNAGYQTAIAISEFKASRQALVDSSVVKVSTGKRFDADEQSISRLLNSIIKNLHDADDTIIKWSTADVDTGVMVDCTKAEIVEAHKLAVEYVEQVWSIN